MKLLISLTCKGNLIISLSRKMFVKNPSTSLRDFGPPMFNIKMPVFGLFLLELDISLLHDAAVGSNPN